MVLQIYQVFRRVLYMQVEEWEELREQGLWMGKY